VVYENPPNVRRIETDRHDVCGFKVCGYITVADIENLYGLLEGAYAAHGRINVIVIIEDYEGFEWNAVWREQTILRKTKAARRIRKYAVVGGPAWVRNAMRFFRPFLSIEMKHFTIGEAEAAWEWVGARPKEPTVT
jgi:hypothetical protein